MSQFKKSSVIFRKSPIQILFEGVTDLLIPCPHCGESLKIRTSNPVVDGIRDYYCNCDNEMCLARPVMQLSHKHDVQPPVSKFLNEQLLIEHALKSWTPEKRKELLKKFEDEIVAA